MSETIELDENTIIGNPVVAENSVKFKANSHGNILFCEDGTETLGAPPSRLTETMHSYTYRRIGININSACP